LSYVFELQTAIVTRISQKYIRRRFGLRLRNFSLELRLNFFRFRLCEYSLSFTGAMKGKSSNLFYMKCIYVYITRCPDGSSDHLYIHICHIFTLCFKNNKKKEKKECLYVLYQLQLNTLPVVSINQSVEKKKNQEEAYIHCIFQQLNY